MPHHARSGGFTLIEVSLAIVIGVIVLGGAITLYNQVKTSAGNSEAKSRALALGSLAEEHAARSSNYPTVLELDNLWKARRPDDASKNPWGGAVEGEPVAGVSDVTTLDNSGSPIVIGDGEKVASPSVTVADRGRLYYFRHPQNGPFWLDDFSLASEADGASGTIRVQGYGIAYVGPKGERWYDVTGKAHALDPDAQSPGGPIRGKITN
ncbi:MAG TPA: type II secretion system protein [Pantanalinema sp.]